MSCLNFGLKTANKSPGMSCLANRLPFERWLQLNKDQLVFQRDQRDESVGLWMFGINSDRSRLFTKWPHRVRSFIFGLSYLWGRVKHKTQMDHRELESVIWFRRDWALENFAHLFERCRLLHIFKLNAVRVMFQQDWSSQWGFDIGNNKKQKANLLTLVYIYAAYMTYICGYHYQSYHHIYLRMHKSIWSICIFPHVNIINLKAI